MNQKHDSSQVDPTTQELITAALMEEEEDRYWELVNVLRLRGTREEFEAALELCKSEYAEQRKLGAEILGQLGHPARPFLDESLRILYELLQHEQDPYVLDAVSVAVGFLHPKDERAVVLMTALKNHSDPVVRHGVAVGLGGYDDDAAISALIDLSSDEDPEVRDWATLGLSQMTAADTAEIREALWQRINDKDNSVKGEAMLGLAVRKDERVIPVIFQALKQRGAARFAAVEAAEAIGNSTLCSALITLRLDPEIDAETLENAISACKCSHG